MIFIDHDNTAVNSMYPLHYRIYLDIIKKYPEFPEISYETWVSMQANGLFELILGPHIKTFNTIWAAELSQRPSPEFYPDWIDTMKRLRNRGYYIAVVTHGLSTECRRAYGQTDFMPDKIYGIPEYTGSRNKPGIFPILDSMNNGNSGPVYVIGDMPVDMKMAENFNTATGIIAAYGDGIKASRTLKHLLSLFKNTIRVTSVKGILDVIP
jgi:phosphoglycolate phosphatase-like HAD superfamily hydrolase